MMPPTINQSVGEFIVEVTALGLAYQLALWVMFCFGVGQAVRWVGKIGKV